MKNVISSVAISGISAFGVQLVTKKGANGDNFQQKRELCNFFLSNCFDQNKDEFKKKSAIFKYFVPGAPNVIQNRKTM